MQGVSSNGRFNVSIGECGQASVAVFTWIPQYSIYKRTEEHCNIECAEENSSFIGKPKIDPGKAVTNALVRSLAWRTHLTSRRLREAFPQGSRFLPLVLKPYPCPWPLGAPCTLHPQKIWCGGSTNEYWQNGELEDVVERAIT